MTAPRRYRIALFAYPARYRKGRGAELLSTLADGDEDRGGPSIREAAALAYCGLLERGRIAVSGDGLLATAAALVLLTMFAGLTWAERPFLYDGEVGASLTEGPGSVALVGLSISAFTVLAAGPFRAVDNQRRRRVAVAIAFFAALVLWSAPGAVFKHSIPDAGELAESLRWNFAGIYSNWTTTLPFAASASAGTGLALRALSAVRASARRRALGAGLVAAGAAAVTTTWSRPDLVAAYAQSAFADLGAAVFVTALGVLLAAVAVVRVTDGCPPSPQPPRRTSVSVAAALGLPYAEVAYRGRQLWTFFSATRYVTSGTQVPWFFCTAAEYGSSLVGIGRLEVGGPYQSSHT